MKKLLCALLCAVLLAGIVPAHAVGVTDVMVVANCSEWVSLRESPDTSSKRLKTVRLGELVQDCTSAPNDFIYCFYDGAWGYILSQYLRPTDFSPSEGFTGNQMVVNCKEWVSMREKPDSSSKRLTKVPLGAVVTSCVAWYGDYVYCEYKGYKGYISTAYLRSAMYNVQKRNDKVVSEAAGKYPAIVGRMQVVNCTSWVSLREKASASSSRITKVELGEYVDQCVQVSGEFIYCHYNGLWGYIQCQYLQQEYYYQPTAIPTAIPTAAPTAVPTAAPTAFSVLTPMLQIGTPAGDGGMAYQPAFSGLQLPAGEILSLIGKNVLDYVSMAGYRVLVQRAYGSREELMAVCYDPQAKPIWQIGVVAPVTEADGEEQTAAFIAGTAEAPLLVLYQREKGFFAYNAGPWSGTLWMTPNSEDVCVDAALTAAADGDGTIYLAFDNKLLCLSPEGALKWRREYEDSHLGRPFSIVIHDTVLEVYYDDGDPAACWRVIYTRDGARLALSQVNRP